MAGRTRPAERQGPLARFPYLDPAAATGEMKALFDQIAGERETGYVPALYRMLTHSPEFARAWLALGTASRRGKVPPKLRELAIIQVGQATRAGYEWSHHAGVARSFGVTPEQIDAVLNGKIDDPSLFDERERAVLAYARASTRDVQVPDEVFEPLRRFFDMQTIIELTITIGFYNMVCRFLLAIKIDLEPGEPPAPW